MIQQGKVLKEIIAVVSHMVILTRSDPIDRGRWNWAQFKSKFNSTHVISAC